MDVEEEIVKKFYGTQCPALQGKPKLFLLQYCRGDEHDLGVLRGTQVDSFKLPEVTDILIANSTVPGFVSNRNTQQGSWFFQCLVEVFKENAKNVDIRDMFDMISRILNEKESIDEEKRKQTLEQTNRGFYKKLYFNPIGEADEDYDTDDEDCDENKQQKNKVGLKKRVKEAWKVLTD
eukprot:GFUD01007509.1.p1 GENE.GFUD01007509.1~~GFUD01007509.1.p1  ORF type:complete len:188 (+),score=53.68 GFUD01007509.1:33-566(+)